MSKLKPWVKRLAIALMAGVTLLACTLVGARLLLSDEQITQYLLKGLNGAFAGHFEAAEVHWRLPVRLELRQVRISPPDSEPVIEVGEARASVDLPALLHGTVQIDSLQLAKVVVRVTEVTPNAEIGLAAAFASRTPSSADPDSKPGIPLPIELRDAQVADGRVEVDLPGAQVTVGGLSMEHVDLWLRDVRLGVSGTAAGLVESSGYKAPLQLHIDDGVYAYEGPLSVTAKQLKLASDGVAVQATGSLQKVDADLQASAASPLLPENIRALLRGAVQGHIAVTHEDALQFDVALQGNQLRVDDVPVTRLHAAGALHDNQLAVRALELEGGDGRVTGDATMQLASQPNEVLGRHTVHLRGAAVPLRHWLGGALAPPAVLPESLDVQVTAAGESLLPLHTHVHVEASARGLAAGKAPSPLVLQADVEILPVMAHVRELRLSGDGADLTLSGAIPFSDTGRVEAKVELHQPHPNRSLERLGAPLQADDVQLLAQVAGSWRDPSVHGMLRVMRLQGRGQAMDVEAPFALEHGRASLTDARVILPHGAVLITGGVKVLQNGRPPANPPVEAHIRAHALRLAEISPALAGDASVDIAVLGTIKQPIGDATVAVAHLAINGAHFDEAEISAHGDAKGAHITRLALTASGGGKVTATGDANWRDHGIHGAVNVTPLAVAWLTQLGGSAPPLAGEVSAHGEVSGTWDAPTYTAQAQLQHAAWSGTELASVQASISGQGDTAKLDVEAKGPMGHLHMSAQGSPQSVDATVQLESLDAAPLLASMGQAGAQATGSGQVAVHYAGSLATLLVSGSIDTLRLASGSTNLQLSAPATFELRDGTLALPPLQLHGSAGDATVQGSVAQLLTAPQLDGVKVVLNADMGLVAAMVPALAHGSGRISVQVSGDGPLQEPRLRGEAHVITPVQIRPRGTSAIGQLTLQSADVIFMPTQIVLHNLRGTLGTGNFNGEGEAALSQFVLHHYRLQVHGTDLPLRTADLIVAANINIVAEGDGAWPSLTGRVDITGGRYGKTLALHDYYLVATQPDAALPLDETAPFLANIPLDIQVGTSSDLSVKIDTGVFMMQTDLNATVHITGNALHPRVEGRVSSTQGMLRFPKAQLQIDEAVLDFVPTASGQLAATVALRAQGDVTPVTTSNSSSSDPYTVTLELNGTLERMALDVTANPSLTRLEALALLATGHVNLMDLTQGGGDTSTLNAALAFAGSQVSDPLSRFAERQIERAINLKVDLATEVSTGSVRLTAAKQITPRLRVEGGYQQSLGDDPTAVITRGQFSITDRLLLEGGATHDLSTGDLAPGASPSQTSLQLKLRILGS